MELSLTGFFQLKIFYDSLQGLKYCGRYHIFSSQECKNYNSKKIRMWRRLYLLEEGGPQWSGAASQNEPTITCHHQNPHWDTEVKLRYISTKTHSTKLLEDMSFSQFKVLCSFLILFKCKWNNWSHGAWKNLCLSNSIWIYFPCFPF